MDIENPPPYDVESLPSYTIVSGLPSYNEVLEQLKQKSSPNSDVVKIHRPSVIKLFEAQSQMLLNSSPKVEEIKYNFSSQKSMEDSEAETQQTRIIPPNQGQKKFNVTTYTIENER